MEPWEPVAVIEPSLIDQALLWVQHPFALFVALALAACLLIRREWKRDQLVRAELSECWELHEQGQREILDLTAFLMESLTLNSTPHTKANMKQVEDLKSRVAQFQHDRELAYERHKADRQARARK